MSEILDRRSDKVFFPPTIAVELIVDFIPISFQKLYLHAVTKNRESFGDSKQSTASDLI